MDKAITACRSCEGENIVDVLSLGDQYLSDFREDDVKPPKHPLNLVFCKDCFLVQLRETTPQSEMYTPRYGFKSGVNNTIKNNLKEIVDEILEIKPDAERWLDIASNDGTLLSFVPGRIWKVGVDPIEKLCEEAKMHADKIINDFFDAEFFKTVVFDNHINFDAITSISCFYDMPDPNRFVSDVKTVLNKGGVWSIQQNYLLTTLELGAVDNICHEHIEYYSLLAMDKLLDRHGLEVFRVETNMVNGGCIRTLVGFKGEHKIEDSVYLQRKKELDFGLDKVETYEKFSKAMWDSMEKLHDTIEKMVEQGKTGYIYGASTRGGTIWQMANLTKEMLPKAVERNPEKVGKKIASIGVPIISEEQARKEKPDFMLVSIWFFKDEVLKREEEYIANGGKLIFPLPKLEVYDSAKH